jgi:hypothetical protein
MGWLDDVSTDLGKMRINEWRDRARDREALRRIVKEAKAHPLRAVAPPKKKNQISNCMKICPVGAELLHADGRMD